jgi:hypothetical protein
MRRNILFLIFFEIFISILGTYSYADISQIVIYIEIIPYKRFSNCDSVFEKIYFFSSLFNLSIIVALCPKIILLLKEKNKRKNEICFIVSFFLMVIFPFIPRLYDFPYVWVLFRLIQDLLVIVCYYKIIILYRTMSTSKFLLISFLTCLIFFLLLVILNHAIYDLLPNDFIFYFLSFTAVPAIILLFYPAEYGSHVKKINNVGLVLSAVIIFIVSLFLDYKLKQYSGKNEYIKNIFLYENYTFLYNYITNFLGGLIPVILIADNFFDFISKRKKKVT